MIVNWNEFIRFAVISNDLQPVTKAEREELKREIDQQTGKINEFTTEVDNKQHYRNLLAWGMKYPKIDPQYTIEG